MDKTNLNPYFQSLEVDYLYHLGLDSSMDLKQQFGDIKFVVLTRSFGDADYFADQFTEVFYGLKDLHIECKTIAKDERYHIYKVANTLIISHGVGFPSMLICLNEVVKLLWHAGVEDYQFIRLSPGGGIGVSNDSVIVASTALDQQLKSEWSNIEFGEYYTYNTIMDDKVSQAMIAANPNAKLVAGKILSTACFYNGQARLNGAIPVTYTEEERDEYLQKAYAAGVRGIDMESGCFTAFCNNFAIPATVVLAARADRLNSNDTIESSLLFDKNIEIGVKTATSAIINYILSNTQRG